MTEKKYQQRIKLLGVFAGFQATIQNVPVKRKPYYYLTLPKPPKKSVVYDVMCRVATVAKKKSMPFVLLVGDQPVYALIVQLKYENQELFDRILSFLCPFHTQCSFMSAINKRFNGSGLSDLLVAADIIAESSVDNASKGKHYKRSVRCFRLMFEDEVLVRRIIQPELNERVSLTPDLKEKLQKLRTPSTSTQEERKLINDELESSAEFSSFVIQAFEKVDSAMARYWLSFLKMTEILMLNIHAVKTQNWEEFKMSLRLMMPWLQVYDNDKYGRWLVEFWLEISCLQEEEAQHMRDGLFAESMTGKPYSCLPLDLWIEMTMKKGSKMKAGWQRIL